VLLDIEMPGLDGFEVIRELSGPPVSDIQAFVCTDEQVYAVTGEQERSMLNHTLKDLEARLNPNSFVRVHKQAIVNIAHVTEIDQASVDCRNNWT